MAVLVGDIWHVQVVRHACLGISDHFRYIEHLTNRPLPVTLTSCRPHCYSGLSGFLQID